MPQWDTISNLPFLVQSRTKQFSRPKRLILVFSCWKNKHVNKQMNVASQILCKRNLKYTFSLKELNLHHSFFCLHLILGFSDSWCSYYEQLLGTICWRKKFIINSLSHHILLCLGMFEDFVYIQCKKLLLYVQQRLFSSSVVMCKRRHT